MIDRKTLLLSAAAFAIGYVVSSSAPQPEPPGHDRPVLRWVAKLAKNLLWVALVAEKPPEPKPENVAKTRSVGGDGYPILDNAEGW